MNWFKLPYCSKALYKCKQWTDPTSFNPKRLRSVLTGIIVNITLAEICGYKILKHDVVGGELGPHIPDIIIICVSCFEGFTAPFVSWWGHRCRRRTLMLWTLASILGTCTWIWLPDPTVRLESELCITDNHDNNTLYTGLTRVSATRLVMAVLVALLLAMARVAIWSHGIAYCEQHCPERITIHYGVILSIRVISLLIGYKIFTSLADTNFRVQVIILVVTSLPGLLQIPFIMPRTRSPPEEEIDERGRNFLQSIARVCSNALAISQMFAMGLLAAALYGYSYYESDIIRVKFLLSPVFKESNNFVQVIQYFFIFFILVFAATRFSAPVLKEYCKRKAIRQVIIMTVLVVIMFVVITVLPRCDKGAVDGLGDSYYGHPDCSYECGCTPRWLEFDPVCAAENMMTYMSPCHAGCSAVELINGNSVYTNCTCSASHVLPGACGATVCRHALELHHTVFLVLVTFIILAFQAQGILILKSVGSVDQSMVFGMSFAMVAIIAFVCGPLIFLGIEAGTCRWYEGERCHLFNDTFPKTVGYTCAFIAMMAALVCMVTSLCIRMANREQSEECKRIDVELTQDTEL